MNDKTKAPETKSPLEGERVPADQEAHIEDTTEETLSFDREIQRKLKDQADRLLLTHPELRSVIAVLDYHGDYNEQKDIRKGVWISEHGDIKTYASIVGSLRQTLSMLELQMQATYSLHMQVDAELHEKMKQLKSLEVKLEQAEKAQNKSGGGAQEEARQDLPDAKRPAFRHPGPAFRHPGGVDPEVEEHWTYHDVARTREAVQAAKSTARSKTDWVPPEERKRQAEELRDTLIKDCEKEDEERRIQEAAASYSSGPWYRRLGLSLGRRRKR